MSRDVMSLLARILEDYKLLREQVFCVNDAWMAEAKQTKDAWVQQVIFADPRLKDIRSWECWPEVSSKLDELDEWMDSQIGSCWGSEAEAHEAIWRGFGLWVKDIKEWALANCNSGMVKPEQPVTKGCGVVTVISVRELWGIEQKVVRVTGVPYLYFSTDFDIEPHVGDQYRMECSVCPSPEVKRGDDCFFYWIG